MPSSYKYSSVVSPITDEPIPISTKFIILSILGICGIVGILLLIFTYSIPSLCNKGNDALHLLEMVSNIFIVLPLGYAIYQHQVFTSCQIFLELCASTLYHLCDQIDQLNCPGTCIMSINSLYYLDLTGISLFIYIVGFYRVQPSVHPLLHECLLVLIPLVLGTIYSGYDANLTTDGFDTFTIVVYSLIGITAIGVLVFRFGTQKHKTMYEGRSFAFWVFAVLCTVIALGIDLAQSVEGYQYSHSWFHIFGSLAVLFYMLYIDENLI